MNEQHFNHVYEKFKKILDQAHHDNLTYNYWFDEVAVSNLTVAKSKIHGWDVVDPGRWAENTAYIFVRIPTLRKAEEILQYFKETEVLFL